MTLSTLLSLKLVIVKPVIVMQPAISPKASLADQAYSKVEELIVTLELPPGHVFSEAELSDKINIGRTPLREALQRLASERLVKAIPRKGMLVSEINITDQLAMLETRRVLDQLVISRAARRATDTQLKELVSIQQQMNIAMENNNIAEFMRLDRLCDEVLEIASRNPFAAQALNSLHAHSRRFWYQYKHEGDITESAQLHIRMIEAVLSRDEENAASSSNAIMDYLEMFTRKALDLS